jgi:hypothetical protein
MGMCWEWNLFYEGKKVSQQGPASGETQAKTYPEVPTARQTSETNNLVVSLAEPGNLPPAKVVDGRESVRRSDTKGDSDTAVADAQRGGLAGRTVGMTRGLRTARVNALRTRVARVPLYFADDFNVGLGPHKCTILGLAI